MTVILRLGACCVLAAMLAVSSIASGPASAQGLAQGVTPVRAYGPAFPPMREPAVDAEGNTSSVVQQAKGCVGTGLGGLLLSAGAGSLNLVNVIGGGAVLHSNNGTLYIALAGVVFASYCAIGSALTPLALHATAHPSPDRQAIGAVTPAAPPHDQLATRPVTPLTGRAARSGVLSEVYDRAGTIPASR